MNRAILILPLALLVTACGKTELVPQLYMPTPPEVLMKKPQELKTIKQEEKKEEAPK